MVTTEQPLCKSQYHRLTSYCDSQTC